MAAAYVKIYINGEELRTYGGNRSDVRAMKQMYDNMTYQQLVSKHPNLEEHIDGACTISTTLYITNHGCRSRCSHTV